MFRVKMFHCGVALILAAISPFGMGADVAVAGVFPGKALLVIDGAAPRIVPVGQQVGGVKVVSIEGESVQIEIDGKRSRLKVGEQPVSVGSSGGGGSGARQITLTADSRGHFYTTGSINGATASFLVDTGATSVAMSPSVAVQAGINYTKGEPGMASTANGVAPMWRVRLNRLSLGEITLRDVEAVVLQAEMPHVLLGMTVLNRMEMQRSGSTMVLKQRY